MRDGAANGSNSRLRSGTLISRLNFRLNAAQARLSAAPRASCTSSALSDRLGNQT